MYISDLDAFLENYIDNCKFIADIKEGENNFIRKE